MKDVWLIKLQAFIAKTIKSSLQCGNPTSTDNVQPNEIKGIFQ